MPQPSWRFLALSWGQPPSWVKWSSSCHLEHRESRRRFNYPESSGDGGWRGEESTGVMQVLQVHQKQPPPQARLRTEGRMQSPASQQLRDLRAGCRHHCFICFSWVGHLTLSKVVKDPSEDPCLCWWNIPIFTILDIKTEKNLKYAFTTSFNLFIFCYARSLLLCQAFSNYSNWGLRSSCNAQASVCGGFSCCRAGALESPHFRSCAAWGQLHCGMWDLPRSGIELMSPALAGGFLTTGPPEKS